MYKYTPHQMYLLGQAYRCLSDIPKQCTVHTNVVSAIEQTADIFPVKHLILKLLRVPSRDIPKRVDKVVQEIMNNINEEEIEELIQNPSPTPMELRMNWHLGYSDGYKLLHSTPISKKRKEKNLTQKKLAQLIGCSQKDISRWENGTHRPSIDNIQKLASALDCSVDELLESL